VAAVPKTDESVEKMVGANQRGIPLGSNSVQFWDAFSSQSYEFSFSLVTFLNSVEQASAFAPGDVPIFLSFAPLPQGGIAQPRSIVISIVLFVTLSVA
jgi:hypothetical protein